MSVIWHDDSGTLLIAVADGVSGSPMSHLGASTACRYAIEYLQRDPAVSAGWRHVLEVCAWALVEADQRLSSRPHADPHAAEAQLATTLCLVTVTPAAGGMRVRAGLVGDSGLATVRDGRIIPLLGGKAPVEDGVIDNSVVPLPRVPADPHEGEWILSNAETLLVATDGIWDPVGDGAGAVGRYLADLLGGDFPDRTGFLQAVDFYRETHDDDRTLVAVRAIAGESWSRLAGDQSEGADGHQDKDGEEQDLGGGSHVTGLDADQDGQTEHGDAGRP
jgi:serine/threonine protein phosphatase PrpC